MSNMSYCSFKNTLEDLEDCYAHIHDKDLSKEEERTRKRKRLINNCKNIAYEFEDKED